jgi:hypothetical protein
MWLLRKYIWKWLKLLLIPALQEDCKTFCPMSWIYPVTIRLTPHLASLPICVEMFHPSYYLPPKVCVYIQIFYTIQRCWSGIKKKGQQWLSHAKQIFLFASPGVEKPVVSSEKFTLSEITSSNVFVNIGWQWHRNGQHLTVWGEW